MKLPGASLLLESLSGSFRFSIRGSWHTFSDSQVRLSLQVRDKLNSGCVVLDRIFNAANPIS